MKFDNSMFIMLTAPATMALIGAGIFAEGYVTPGGGPFGRFGGMYNPNMMRMTPEQRNEMRRQQTEFVNRAFEALVDELNNKQRKTTTRNQRRSTTETSKDKPHQQQQGSNDEDDVAGGKTSGSSSSTVDFLEDLVNGIGEYCNDGGGYYDNDTEQFVNLAKKGLGIVKDVMGGTYSPAYDINEDESMLEISIDLPGVSNSDIDIEVKEDDKLLIVSGKREDKGRRTTGSSGDDAETTKKQPMTFSKTFPLDESIDTTTITASSENGVLVIKALKMKKEDKPSTGKRIPVL